MSWILAVALLVAATQAASVSQAVLNATALTPCTGVDPNALTANCGGTSYSMDTLQPSTKSWFTYADAQNNYLYFIQIVDGGLPTSITFSGSTCTLPAAGYAVGQLNTVTGACYPLAQVPSLSPSSWALDTTSAPQILSVTLTGGAGGRKVTLDVQCYNNINPNVQSTSEAPALQYNFAINQCSGCSAGCSGPTPPPPGPLPPPPPGPLPPPPPGPLPPPPPGPFPPPPPGPTQAPTTQTPSGSTADPSQSSSSASFPIGNILLIVFFGVLGLYFIIGAVYQFKAKGARGTEMVIHNSFWFALPGLVRDGFKFTIAKVRRQEYQRL